LATDQFLFAGFLPARAGARRTKLTELRSVSATLVFYEAPHRIAATLKDALEVLGNRHAVIARELTKLHEQFLRGSLSELIGRFSESEIARGEMVLIISGQSPAPASTALTKSEQFRQRMNELERDGVDEKTALKRAAKEMGLKRDDAYRIVLSQKNLRSR
jgi:16S rRNA (cytidine1402-2'-O)-methyltransferase